MNYVIDGAVSFVFVFAGLSFLFMTQANLADLLLGMLCFVIFTLFAFYIFKKLPSSRYVKTVYAVLSVISASFSLMMAAKLVINSGALPKEFYPLIFVLSCILPLCCLVSKISAIRNITLICALISAFSFVIISVLCFVDTDFSKVFIQSPDLKSFLPLLAFAVLDIIFAFPLINSKNPLPVIVGGGSAFVFFCLFILTAMTVFSKQIYLELETPLLKLWQSTFITSFINQFEIVALSFVYLIVTLKSGISLFSGLKWMNVKKRTPIIAIVLIIGALLSFL